LAGHILDVRRFTGGLGRRAAAVGLLLFLVCQIGFPVAFDVPRVALFDAYQQILPRHRDPRLAPVVIVAIDDPSLKAEGSWPWPREKQARLIESVLAARPAAVGIDVLWPEATGAGDGALAKAVGDGPVVIGVQGVTGEDCGRGGGDTGAFAPVLMAGGAPPLGALPCFPTDLRSIPAIDLAAAGHGVISSDPDRDGFFRRLHLLSTIDGRVAPSLALDTYRLTAGAPLFSLRGDRIGVRGVGVGKSVFPVERDGTLRIDFAPRDEWTVCSAETLLQGMDCRGSPGGPVVSLNGRVVLIGLEASGVTDQQRKTPIGPMPGVEINAQGLENLFVGRLVHRPTWAPLAEAALTLGLGLFLIALLPIPRPMRQVIVALAPLGLLAVLGALSWGGFRVLVDVATPAIGCGVVYVCLLGGGLAEADAQRRRLRRQLEIERLAAARAEGEMEAGRRIQMGILPTPASLAADVRFDLDAVMIPARQIGGDLYDFFKIDEDHLFIAVGDVSGKGLPASLFMALGKSLCKSCALRGETDIGAIVRRANAEISRDNPEMLFITLFAGILNLRTGELLFCNAGHDPPILLRGGESPRLVAAEGGPPLCVVDDFAYPTEACQLSPGDLLCVTTDGVNEAMTAGGVPMGRERMVDVLAGTAPEDGAKVVTGRLRSAVEDYVAGAEPSDDLTILTIRWLGPRQVNEP
jgi:serine phosphatase RsbU (regulator of sigma subunit)